ncbi:MAG TPA: hypothetical protein VH833_12835 [Gemmatimonadales bacterium]|jgi:hypothetical protein
MVRLLAAAVLLVQSADTAPRLRIERPELRAGLDTLYAGDFAVAIRHFAELSARDTTDPAPVIFHAGAYIWWAAARDSDAFEADRIDSLLDAAIAQARAQSPGALRDFWLASALGYRARERELHGHAWGAAKDAKAMRDAYRRVLAADSSCTDCWLGLGLYSYGLARASTFAKIVAKLIGLGGGNAEQGIAMMQRVATGGDLARVEATWVLAAALVREAERDKKRRESLRAEAIALVNGLAIRYPTNPVFQRFLRTMSESQR